MSALTVAGLNNGKVDLDHIAEVATSTGRTATDRMGNVKLTVAAAVESLKAFNPRGVWVAGTDYAVKDVFTSSGIAYVVVSAHRSVSVASDLLAGKVVVHQGATWEDLALRGGAAAVGFDDFTVADALRAIEGLTYLNADLYLLNQKLNGIANNLRAVLVGDSLGFNGFGYAPPFSVNGGGYATDQPFGMQSWAHMIRDLWVSSGGGYTPIVDIHRYTNCAAVTAPSIPDCPQLGMNVRALKFTFTNAAQALTLWHRYVGSTDVLVSYAPASEAVLFQINGVEYDNTSPDGHYQSRGYMRVTGVPISTSINNVRKKSDGSAGSLWIYGTTNAGGVTPRLTAKGGWTSGQILAEYSTLVAPYAPDVVFYIIGANDIGLNVPVAQFKNNVSAFIDLVRGNRPNAIIILISTPPTSSYSKAVAMPYMLAARQLAVARSCSFVDLWAALEKIDPAYYRIDNIHFKPAGDGYVFNVLKKLIFPNVQIESRRMLPEREAYMGVSGTELVMKPEDFSIVFLMGSVPTVFDTSNVYPAAVTTCSYKTVGSMPIFSVVAPYGFTVNSSMSMVFDEPFGRAIKQRLYGEAGEAQFYLANGDALLDIKGCGLYLTVSFTRDMTVLL